MKITSIALLVLASIVAYGQDVPKKVETAFAAKYSAVDEVEWEEIKGGFSASFMLNESDLYADFSANGEWLQTKEYIDESALSANIADAVDKAYPNASYESVAKITTKDNKIKYIINLDVDGDTYLMELASSGTVLASAKVISDFDDE